MARALALASLALILAACDTPDSRLTSTTFDGNKKLVLFAAYSTNAGAITIQGFADVPAGTVGELEMTGPFHMRCEGRFQPMDPNHTSPDNLPSLDVGDGSVGVNLHAPGGSYTAIVTLPAQNATLRKSFKAGSSPPDARTGTYELPLGCAPIADTIPQLNAMVPLYVAAVRYWVNLMEPSDVRSQVVPLAVQANDDVSAGNYAAALDKLVSIRDLVGPLPDQGPYFQIRRDVHAAIALLSQPPPGSPD